MNPNSAGITESIQGALGLLQDVNKGRPREDGNLESQQLDLFASSMTEAECIAVRAQMVEEWNTYKAKERLEELQRTNINYWLGRHFTDNVSPNKRPMVDNAIFEAIETFLPMATRANPEANVTSDGSEDGDKAVDILQTVLPSLANTTGLRMKLKSATRNWLLYFVGITKIIWDAEKDEMDITNPVPSKVRFDPKGYWDVFGNFHGNWVDEELSARASDLIERFPKKAEIIKQAVQGKLGTSLPYYETWVRTKGGQIDVFYSYNKTVLGKFKNPHWNYDADAVKGKNFLKRQEFPYVGLCIFNLGRKPHDETNLIYQNIPLQDSVNKGNLQIEKNVDAQNNGIVLSGDHFTREQASEATTQLSMGNALWVPKGDINSSYKRDTAPSLSSDVFRRVDSRREQIASIFGTSGSTPQALEGQKTVRGKVLVSQADSSRIGGGVSDFIEQNASTIYQWFVQMIYVYYDEERRFSAEGEQGGFREVVIHNVMFLNVPVTIKVKEGSLVPKDPLTKRNEAIDLWSANAIDPISFYKQLGYPNALEMAKNLLYWRLIQEGKISPEVLFPGFMSETGQVAQNTSPAVSPTEDNASMPGQVENSQPAPQDMERQLLQSVQI